MGDTETGLGKVVVNRAMSVDGFIAGPEHEMDWIIGYQSSYAFPEIMAATGAMLVGRRTYEVSRGMSDEDTSYDGGPVFVLTHRPPDEPQPGVTFLSCSSCGGDRHRAGRRRREEPGDPRCRPGQSVPPAGVRRRGAGVRPAGAAGDGVHISASGLGRIDLEPFSNTQSGR